MERGELSRDPVTQKSNYIQIISISHKHNWQETTSQYLQIEKNTKFERLRYGLHQIWDELRLQPSFIVDTREDDLTLQAAPGPSNQLERDPGEEEDCCFSLFSPLPDSDHLPVFCPASQESAESWANLIGFGSTNKSILRAIWAKLMSPHPQTMFVLNILYYKAFSHQFRGPCIVFLQIFPLDNIRPYWKWLQYIMACALTKINIWGKLLVSSYIFDVSVSNMNGLCLYIWF